jgi:hypothetical protein
MDFSQCMGIDISVQKIVVIQQKGGFKAQGLN